MKKSGIYLLILLLNITFWSIAQEVNSVQWHNPFSNGEGKITYTISPSENPNGQQLFQINKNSIEVLYSWKGQKAPFGTITTNKTYSHYNLELEYKWGQRKFEPRFEAKRDAGILFHIQGDNVVWPTALECQVQEGDTGDLWVIKSHQALWVQKDGSEKLLDSREQPHFIQGTKYANHEVEGWNKVRVEVRGAEGAKFYENGHLVNEIKNLKDAEGNPLHDGRLALQAEGAEITYRNVRIQELPSPQKKNLVIKEKPNIIVVLTDDQGWADVGFNGATDIPTPNLDRLASEGVVFSNGYVTHPYCSPSRAGLLTGRYQARFGHDCNMPYDGENDATVGTPLSEKMISEALIEIGYRTSAIGKWHIGDHPDLHPTQQGFDHWFGFAGGGMNYWGKADGPLRTIFRNGDPVPESELHYLTDDFTEEAIRVITKKDNKPFFIYLAYNAPHAPDQATENYLKQTEHIEYGGRSVYGAMVNAIDAGVGRIDSTLIANGLKENTLLIYLSDNGGRGEYADNRPYRGYKGMLYEGGIKVPFFINWPKAIPKNQRFEKVISALDIFPTALEAAGKNAAEETQLEGVNLLPYIQGKNNETPHEKLFWRSVGGFEYAVRIGDFKLYKRANTENLLLFDLNNDPYERTDVASQHPKMVADLEKAYADWDAKNLPHGWEDPHEENVIKEQQRLEATRKKAMKPKN